MSDGRDGKTTRRAFLGWAGAAAGAASLGALVPGGPALGAPVSDAGVSGGRPFAGQRLRVFIYSGAWEKTMREAFVPKFEQRTSAQVVLDPGWWDSIPKLKASPKGQPAFDLVLTDATQGYPAIKEGLFQQIDLRRIPNKDRLAPSVLDNRVYAEGYGIPFPESVMTLGYNRKLVKFTPASWGDLLRPDISGKLGLYNSFYMSLYTFACMKVASEGRAGTAFELCGRDLKAVVEFARQHRDRVKYWWPTSTDMALSLSQHNCAIGNMHSPDMLSAMRQRKELAAVVPQKDRAFVQLMWVVPAGTRVKELAEAAIDFLLGDEMQEAFARNGSTTANLAVAKRMAEADPLWGQIYPSTAEQLKTVQYYPYEAYFKDWDDLVAVWDREILRKKGR